MVYKGCVLKEEKNHIIVLTNDSNYIKLKKKDPIDIGKEILFLEEDIIKNPSIQATSLTAVAAAIIFLFISTALLKGFGFQFMDDSTAYAMVSLDINPSIHFELDKDDNVLKTIPLNEEANALLTPTMIGMAIEDAIHLAIRSAIDQHYLADESDMVLISKVNLKGDENHLSHIEQTISEEIQGDQDIQDIEILYVDSSKEHLEDSQKENMSIGKYALYEQIHEENPNESIEQIKSMKVTEIVNKNKSLIKVKPFVKTSNGKKQEPTEIETSSDQELKSTIEAPDNTKVQTEKSNNRNKNQSIKEEKNIQKETANLKAKEKTQLDSNNPNKTKDKEQSNFNDKEKNEGQSNSVDKVKDTGQSNSDNKEKNNDHSNSVDKEKNNDHSNSVDKEKDNDHSNSDNKEKDNDHSDSDKEDKDKGQSNSDKEDKDKGQSNSDSKEKDNDHNKSNKEKSNK